MQWNIENIVMIITNVKKLIEFYRLITHKELIWR